MTARWMFVLAVVVPGLLVAWRCKGESRIPRLLAALATMGGVVVLFHVMKSLANGPFVEMNSSRVANAIALAMGFNILPGADEGPLIDFMYGPVFALAYTPTALAGTPTGAVWLGILLTFSFVMLPFAWLVYRQQPSRLVASAAVVCLGLLSSIDPSLQWAAWFILSDAPALAFAAIACACLMSGRASPTNRQMGCAALCAVLAVWSKQTTVPILLALPLYLWMLHGWRTAFRLALFIAGAGLLVSLLFLLWFGFDGILFNLFQVPGGVNWKYTIRGGSRLGDFYNALSDLLVTSAPSGLLVLLLAGLNTRRGVSVREWLRSQPWTMLAWVALLMMPTATVAMAKIGGEHNVLAISTYFMTSAALLGLAQTAATSRPFARVTANFILAGIMAFGVGEELVRVDGYQSLHRAVQVLRNWRSYPDEQGLAFARAHPDEVHFITNPLIGLYSERKLYSNMFGRYDRQLAGYPTSHEMMLGHAPSRLRYVVVRRNFPWFTKPAVYPEYQDFTVLVEAEELPDYFVWERAPGPGSGAGPAAK